MTRALHPHRDQPVTAGDRLSVLGDIVTFKATGADTGGTLTALEVSTQPASGPPPHTHIFAELFYVLDGELDVFLETGWRRLAVGEVAVVPGGAVHTYRGAGESEARFLAVLHPAGHEDFLAELGVPAGTPARPGPPDIDRMMEIAHRHGIRFVS